MVLGTSLPGTDGPFPSLMEMVVQALSLIVHNTVKSCWFSKSDKIQTTADGYSILTRMLGKDDEIRFATGGGALMINGQRVEADSVYSNAFLAQLLAVSANNFVFTRGLTEDEFDQFIAILCAQPHQLAAEGGFSAAIAKAGFQHVESRKVIMREISEDEAVVEKRKLEEAMAAERTRAQSHVKSLLNGEEPAPGEDVTGANMLEVVADSNKMADMVVETVLEKQGEKIDKDVTLNIIVDAMQRTFKRLMHDPQSKTQKGKKEIAKAFKDLEEELIQRITDFGPEGAKRISDAVEHMTERLQTDAIADDYVKKLKALERSEKQILRFIKAQGLEAVKDTELASKLNEGGLDVSGWHRLLAISEAPDGSEGSVDAKKAVENLATLLGQMELATEDPEKAKQVREEMAGNVEGIGREIKILTQSTLTKVDDLVRIITDDMDLVNYIEDRAAREGRPVKVSRRRMLAVLAEAIQELCQPLSVIHCCVDLVASKALGGVSNEQNEMLKMAVDSALRMRTIINNLGKIVGMPDTSKPDASIQKELNE